MEPWVNVGNLRNLGMGQNSTFETDGQTDLGLVELRLVFAAKNLECQGPLLTLIYKHEQIWQNSIKMNDALKHRCCYKILRCRKIVYFYIYVY